MLHNSSTALRERAEEFRRVALGSRGRVNPYLLSLAEQYERQAELIEATAEPKMISRDN
jgi:hypothetical protein